MQFDATFWVAISFFIFFGALIYFKIPQSVNNLLNKMIGDIKNEIDDVWSQNEQIIKIMTEMNAKIDSLKSENAVMKKKLDSIEQDILLT